MTVSKMNRGLTIAINKLIKSGNRIDPAELRKTCNEAGYKVQEYIEFRKAHNASWKNRTERSLDATQLAEYNALNKDLPEWEKVLMRGYFLTKVKGTIEVVTDDDFVG